MENNPLGYTTPPWSYPLPSQDFTAFYDWVVSEVGSLNPGDTFLMTLPNISCTAPTWDCWIYCYQHWASMPPWSNLYPGYMTTVCITTAHTAICLKYEGQQAFSNQNPLTTPLYFNNSSYPVPGVTSTSCCVSTPIAGGSSARMINNSVNIVRPKKRIIDNIIDINDMEIVKIGTK